MHAVDCSEKGCSVKYSAFAMSSERKQWLIKLFNTVYFSVYVVKYSFAQNRRLLSGKKAS